MTLFKKAEEKLVSKNRRRRQKAIKQIKDEIDPKIDHNVKNINLESRIFNTMGKFESNKFCKMLQHENDIIEKYRRQAVRVQKVKSIPKQDLYSKTLTRLTTKKL